MKILYQCGILFGVCVVGDIISALTRLPIPGSVFGLALLFVLLSTGVLKKAAIREVSKFLLTNMSFFFIPSGVAILAYYKQVEAVAVPLLLIIVFSTIIVLGVTGQSAQLVQFLVKKRGAGQPAGAKTAGPVILAVSVEDPELLAEKRREA